MSGVRTLLGVDPGTRVTGYALIRIEQSGLCSPLDFGCIRLPEQHSLSSRYHAIYLSLLQLMEQCHEVAVEMPFIDKNPQSALKLGGVVGCTIIAAKQRDLPVYGYSPMEVKRGIAGSGRATKGDVQAMVCRMLSISASAFREDASDALSIALYHSSRDTLSMQHREL